MQRAEPAVRKLKMQIVDHGGRARYQGACTLLTCPLTRSWITGKWSSHEQGIASIYLLDIRWTLHRMVEGTQNPAPWRGCWRTSNSTLLRSRCCGRATTRTCSVVFRPHRYDAARHSSHATWTRAATRLQTWKCWADCRTYLCCPSAGGSVRATTNGRIILISLPPVDNVRLLDPPQPI